MSLCRWSHSPFYIFKECGSSDNEIKVQFEGSFTSDEILTNPIKNVYSHARNSGYGILHSIELLIWLYPWALYNKDKVHHKLYNKILNFTRFLSYIRTYLKGDYSSNFRRITKNIDVFVLKMERFVVNDPIHKLSREEKRKIYEEAGYLRAR